ncbi:Eukaryotic translation initiation factor 2 subunit 3 [Podila epigama]|nr:Eukaryotic translation initiation factor 2 subunit 3 [Podila epigama]
MPLMRTSRQTKSLAQSSKTTHSRKRSHSQVSAGSNGAHSRQRSAASSKEREISDEGASVKYEETDDWNESEVSEESGGSGESDETPEGQYEVGAIRGIRNLGTKLPIEFLVHWKHFDESANTWEPLDHLENCMELVCKYLQNPFGATSVKSITPTSSSYPSDKMSKILKEFEDIFKASSSGMKITVENTVDGEGAPKNFTYISSPIFGVGVPVPDPQFRSSCSCGPGGCDIKDSGPCDCLQEAIEVNEYRSVPYEADGRVSELSSMLLWQCNDSCGCGPGCAAKVSQQGCQVALRIKRTVDKGWGVFLDQDEPIPPRTYVTSYIGEIITNMEAEKRGRMYDKIGTTYLFDLDYNPNKIVYSVDAYRFGNESHFLNHSCDPNLSVYVLMGEYGDPNLTTLSFWSNRTIYKGDELTFDYDGIFQPPWLARGRQLEAHSHRTEPSSKFSTSCLCGAANSKDREEEAAELASYFSKFSAALTRLEEELGRWKNYEADYEALKSTLLDLPKETSHNVMVPIGSLAFMPGKLIHTNEVLVMLGDNWFVDRSAAQAAEIVDRRMEFVQENITKLRTQEDELRNKSGMAPGLLGGQEYNEEGLPIVEITEPYFSDDEEPKENSTSQPALLPYSQKTPEEQAEDQAILRRLAELEQEDEERERRREAGEVVTSDEETESEEEEEFDDGESEDEFRPKALDSDEEYEEEVYEHSENEDDDQEDEPVVATAESSNRGKSVRFADQVGKASKSSAAPSTPASKPKSPADLFNQMRARQQAVRSTSNNEQIVNMANLEATFAGLTTGGASSSLGKAPVFDAVPEKENLVATKTTELKSALKPTPKKTSVFKQARMEQGPASASAPAPTPRAEVAPVVTESPADTTVAPKKLSRFAQARQAAAADKSSPSATSTQKPAQPSRMGVSDIVMEREIVAPTLPAAPKSVTSNSFSTPGVSGVVERPSAALRETATKKEPTQASGAITGFKDVIENTFTKAVPTTSLSDAKSKSDDNVSNDASVSGGRRKKSLFKQQQSRTYLEPEPAIPGSSYEDPEADEEWETAVPKASVVPEVVSRAGPGRSVEGAGPPVVVATGKTALQRSSKPSTPLPAVGSRNIPVVASSKLKDTPLMKGAIVEREDIEPVDEDELEEDMLMRQVVSAYQERRQAMIAKHGAFNREDIERIWEQQVVIPEGMVIPEPENYASAMGLDGDDDKEEDDVEEEEAEEDGQVEDDRNARPKKLSLFRASRLTGSLAKQPRN